MEWYPLPDRHPTNFTALNEQAGKFLRARQWEAAKAPLKKLIELYPNQHEEDSAYAELAKVHRELGETEEELAVLKQLAELSPDATNAFARLIELARARSDWPAMETNAARYAAVNPLQPLAHRAAAEAAEALGKKPAAITAYRTLLQLDPTDPAEIHYRLARLLRETGAPGAKREVLLALEEAPRFHAALKLLLEIEGTPH